MLPVDNMYLDFKVLEEVVLVGESSIKIPWVEITKTSDVARALNWRNFGNSLQKPALGSVATLTRKGGGHVGTVVAYDRDRPGWVIMLGGNQSDAVNYRSYPISILKFNFPTGYTPNYNLPYMSGVPKGVKMY